jgi:hypothetical protein
MAAEAFRIELQGGAGVIDGPLRRWQLRRQPCHQLRQALRLRRQRHLGVRRACNGGAAHAVAPRQ